MRVAHRHDNGGNPGLSYSITPINPEKDVPFARQLQGPFNTGVQTGFPPTPDLWSVVSVSTSPLHSFLIIRD